MIPSVHLARAFRDLLWPSACLACGGDTSNRVLCISCLNRSRRIGCTFEPTEDVGICPPIAVWSFDRDAPIRVVLHRLKYGNCPWIGRDLGRAVAAENLIPSHHQWDMIIPVPLHARRYLDRGYNQSSWIARGLGESLQIPVHESGLVRSRNTRTQTTLVRDQRAANVYGAFAVGSRDDVAGCSVLLVDDTLTTGATLQAASETLLEAGASIVQPFALAQALLRKDQEQQDDRSVIPSESKKCADVPSSLGYYL